MHHPSIISFSSAPFWIVISTVEFFNQSIKKQHPCHSNLPQKHRVTLTKSRQTYLSYQIYRTSGFEGNNRYICACCGMKL